MIVGSIFHQKCGAVFTVDLYNKRSMNQCPRVILPKLSPKDKAGGSIEFAEVFA